MTSVTLPSAAHSPRSPARLAAVFLVLFVAYQLPEGLGMRTLDSLPVAVALLLLFLPLAWWCGRAIGFAGLDAWYLGRSPRWVLLLALCFLLSVLAKLAALDAGNAIGVYRIVGGGLGVGAWLSAALLTVPLTFFPSVAEDIVTRGFLMRAFPGLAARWLFIPVSALVYVLNHIYRLSNGPGEWTMLFVFGLAYAAALYYGRSLWPAVGLHWGWNYAGKLADKVASVDALVDNIWLMSVGAHLILLALAVKLIPAIAARRR